MTIKSEIGFAMSLINCQVWFAVVLLSEKLYTSILSTMLAVLWLILAIMIDRTSK